LLSSLSLFGDAAWFTEVGAAHAQFLAFIPQKKSQEMSQRRKMTFKKNALPMIFEVLKGVWMGYS